MTLKTLSALEDWKKAKALKIEARREKLADLEQKIGKAEENLGAAVFGEEANLGTLRASRSTLLAELEEVRFELSALEGADPKLASLSGAVREEAEGLLAGIQKKYDVHLGEAMKAFKEYLRKVAGLDAIVEEANAVSTAFRLACYSMPEGSYSALPALRLAGIGLLEAEARGAYVPYTGVKRE